VTDAEKIQTLIRCRLEQADEPLSAAAINLAHDFHRSAVNRAYYAMFYAVLALLASRQLETSRHSGAISQFDQLFVKVGALAARILAMAARRILESASGRLRGGARPHTFGSRVSSRARSRVRRGCTPASAAWLN